MSETEKTGQGYSLYSLVLYFLKLGTIGFGGPIALVGYMEHDLVEERGWLTKEEFVRGLAFSQLAPGPLAAQLGIYIGFVKARILGATLVGLAFILPSFLMVVVLGFLYKTFGGLSWISAAFYGVSAAVIGIIIKSTHKLVKITLKKNVLLWGVFLVMCVITAITEQEIFWLFLLSGVICVLVSYRSFPNISAANIFIVPFKGMLAEIPVALQSESLWRILLFFTKSSLFVFGSGLAIVPFLYGGVVQEYHWLTDQQFIDAVAVAMITPGPVVITVGFIGYLVGDFPGAAAAAIGVFLPVYLFVVILAPYFERFSQNRQVKAFIEGVTAAATGAIAGAVIVLGRRAIVDLPTALLVVLSFFLLFKFKIPEPVIILGAAILGLVLFPLRP